MPGTRAEEGEKSHAAGIGDMVLAAIQSSRPRYGRRAKLKMNAVSQRFTMVLLYKLVAFMEKEVV